MNNTNGNYNKQKAIVMSLESFRDLMYELCGESTDVQYDGCGLLVSDEHGNTNMCYNKLGSHFGVKVNYLHVNPDSDNLDVWIAYEEIE